MQRTALVLMCLGAAGCAPILGIEDTVFEAGGDSCTLVEQRIFFADKVVDPTNVTIGVVTEEGFGSIASLLGTTVNPQRGHMVATMVDCAGTKLEDASLSLEPPDPNAMLFAIGESGLTLGEDSSSLGMVGALNATAPTEFALEAYPDQLGNDLSSTGDVETAAGVIANIVLAPNSETSVPMMVMPSSYDFGCVGNVDPPVATNATTTITVNVRLSQTLAPLGQPLAGVRVRVCLDSMATCAIDLSKALDPVNEAETDATGAATLVVDTPSDGFDGQLLVAGKVPGCS